MRYCSTCGSQTDGTVVHYCNPIPVAQLSAQLATVTAERDALAKCEDELAVANAKIEEALKAAHDVYFASDTVSAMNERHFKMLAILSRDTPEGK